MVHWSVATEVCNDPRMMFNTRRQRRLAVYNKEANDASVLLLPELCTHAGMRNTVIELLNKLLQGGLHPEPTHVVDIVSPAVKQCLNRKAVLHSSDITLCTQPALQRGSKGEEVHTAVDGAVDVPRLLRVNHTVQNVEGPQKELLEYC